MDTNNVNRDAEEKDVSASDVPASPAPDTTHLASQVIEAPKKSHKKLIITLILLVVVIGAAAGAAYWYKTATDKASEDTAQAEATPTPSSKPKSVEEQATAALQDGIDKETEALTKSDDTEYIKNSTAAATRVGGDLNEQDLEE